MPKSPFLRLPSCRQKLRSQSARLFVIRSAPGATENPKEWDRWAYKCSLECFTSLGLSKGETTILLGTIRALCLYLEAGFSQEAEHFFLRLENWDFAVECERFGMLAPLSELARERFWRLHEDRGHLSEREG